jgi:Na+/H+-dicarboxylate symporter
MIAVPLIVVSLIVADLKDISKLSTEVEQNSFLLMFNSCSSYYWFSLANLIKPGKYINEESRQSLIENFSTDVKK